MLSPAALTVSNKKYCRCRRFLQPTQQSVSARIEPGSSGLGSRRRTALSLDAVTVSVVVIAPLDCDVNWGEKLHEAPAGKPEQVNESNELNPCRGVTEIEVVALCPPETVSDAGELATEKSGGMV